VKQRPDTRRPVRVGDDEAARCVALSLPCEQIEVLVIHFRNQEWNVFIHAKG
jgi:hypothetical protein